MLLICARNDCSCQVINKVLPAKGKAKWKALNWICINFTFFIIFSIYFTKQGSHKLHIIFSCLPHLFFISSWTREKKTIICNIANVLQINLHIQKCWVAKYWVTLVVFGRRKQIIAQTFIIKNTNSVSCWKACGCSLVESTKA